MIVRRTIRDFLADQSGANAIEYGLLAGLIAVAILAALALMGGSISDMFNMVSTRSIGVLDNARG